MATKILYDRPRAGGFIVSEANVGSAGVSRSRESIVLAQVADTLVSTGAVLGKVTASGEYVAYNPAGTDGSEVVAGILFDERDVSESTANAVAITNDAEVNAEEIVWGDALTATEIATAVGALTSELRIKVRPSNTDEVSSEDAIAVDIEGFSEID